MAIIPTSGHSSTKPSSWTGRSSRISVRAERLRSFSLTEAPLPRGVWSGRLDEQAAAGVDLRGLADQRRAAGRRVLVLQLVGQVGELLGRGGVGAQRVVHRE